MLEDVLLGQHRPAGRDPAHQRQRQLLAHRVAQPDAARSPRQQLDDTLARQRAQMLLGGIRGAKSKLGRDFGARRRHSGLEQAALDVAQHVGLAWCEI